MEGRPDFLIRRPDQAVVGDPPGDFGRTGRRGRKVERSVRRAELRAPDGSLIGPERRTVGPGRFAGGPQIQAVGGVGSEPAGECEGVRVEPVDPPLFHLDIAAQFEAPRFLGRGAGGRGRDEYGGDRRADDPECWIMHWAPHQP